MDGFPAAENASGGSADWNYVRMKYPRRPRVYGLPRSVYRSLLSESESRSVMDLISSHASLGNLGLVSPMSTPPSTIKLYIDLEFIQ